MRRSERRRLPGPCWRRAGVSPQSLSYAFRPNRHRTRARASASPPNATDSVFAMLGWTGDSCRLTGTRFAGLKRSSAPSCTPPGSAASYDLLGDERPPALITGLYHHLGTTRMHVDPRHGVVEPSCRVHGVSDLYVTGGSVFPTSGAANPTLTIVALAMRLADELKRVLKVP